MNQNLHKKYCVTNILNKGLEPKNTHVVMTVSLATLLSLAFFLPFFVFNDFNRVTSGNSFQSSMTRTIFPQVSSNYSANLIQNWRTSEKTNAEMININRWYSGEPAPMGIADYGIGSSGPYQYATNSSVGIVTIASLSTNTSTGSSSMSFQQNVNLGFVSGNKQYVYWVQNVAALSTSSRYVYFVNNVWNASAYMANMMKSGISGNGSVASSSAGAYYFDVAGANLRGNAVYLTYPATITLNVTAALNSIGCPTVSFSYDDGYGLITYDNVTFPTTSPVSSLRGFMVNGFNYNPDSSFCDSELVLGGPAGGKTTVNLQSDVHLQLEYWNGHNYQLVSNAYNFGSNTAETISNTLSTLSYSQANGTAFASIKPQIGSLGRLFYQSDLAMVDVKSSIVSGSLYLANASYPNANTRQYPFVNGEVNFTIFPGTYNLKIYQNGAFYDQINFTVNADQSLILNAPFNQYNVTLNYSVFGGGSNYSIPILSYINNGIVKTINLTTIPVTYQMDPGNLWNVSTALIGQFGNERWQTNQLTSQVSSLSQTLYFAYYHQYQAIAKYSTSDGLVSTAIFSLSGTQFGSSLYQFSLTNSNQTIWLDSNSQWSTNAAALVSSNERWSNSNATNASGIVTGPIRINPVYTHQLYLTVNSANGLPNPTSGWFDAGTTINASVDSPILANVTTRYLCTGWRGTGNIPASGEASILKFIINAPSNVTWNWNSQYYFNTTSYFVSSSTFGSTSNGNWYDAGTLVHATVASSTSPAGTGIQYAFVNWSGDVFGTSLTSSSIPLNGPKTAIANWKTQYYLTVSSPIVNVGGAGWYDSGSQATASIVSAAPVSENAGIQYVFEGWSGDASGAGLTSSITMNNPKTATVNWKTQYYLTVNSEFGNVGGQGWYDQGTSVSATIVSLVAAEVDGARQMFNGWVGDASGVNSSSNLMLMDSPKTATANWKPQFYLDLSSNCGVVKPGSGWYDADSAVAVSAEAPISGSEERFVWTGWNGTNAVVDNNFTVNMNGPLTEVAFWAHQYWLAVDSSYGSPSLASGWYNAQETVVVSINDSPVAASLATHFVYVGWIGTGSVPNSGKASNVQFTIEQPSSITWNWTNQFYFSTSLIAIIAIAIAVMSFGIFVFARKARGLQSLKRSS
jgi:hypothetical protein